MTGTVHIAGLGAVSPAGWGKDALVAACQSGEPIPASEVSRPGWERRLRVRQVPALSGRPAFLKHPRMRRAGPISRYAAYAALEALGEDKDAVLRGDLRVGVVVTVMSGCVIYSRRFYHEVWTEPEMASPLVFPETVFNAPASHIAALLESPDLNCTFVGDQGTFLRGMGLAAKWVAEKTVDGCLVVGAEELDWVTPDAFRLFAKGAVVSEGAGAVYLRRGGGTGQEPLLERVTTPHSYAGGQGRDRAAEKMRRELPAAASDHVLLDGLQGVLHWDRVETALWQDWQGSRWSPKRVLGEGLSAAAAWQTVVGAQALEKSESAGATVSVVGLNQQAIGAHLRTQSG